MQPIPGFDDYYAQKDGEILSRRGNSTTFLSPSENRSGSKIVTLYRDGERTTRTVSSLVLSAYERRPYADETACQTGDELHIDCLEWQLAGDSLTSWQRLQIIRRSRIGDRPGPDTVASDMKIPARKARAYIQRELDVWTLYARDDYRDPPIELSSALNVSADWITSVCCELHCGFWPAPDYDIEPRIVDELPDPPDAPYLREESV